MTGDTAELRDWWVIKSKSGKYHLVGYTYNDSRASPLDQMEWGSAFMDGHQITTTAIASLEGERAVTKSGTVYKLNPPAESSDPEIYLLR